MRREALLDTNVIRSFKGEHLDHLVDRLRTRWSLSVSPVTVLELIQNLDQSRFASIRKLHSLNLRYSPLYEAILGSTSTPRLTKWWTLDREHAQKLVRMAASSSNCDDFRRRTFQFDGHQYSVDEFAGYAQRQMAALLSEFRTAVQSAADSLPAVDLTAEHVMRFAVALSQELARAHGARPERLLDSFYFYSIYVLSRAVESRRSATRPAENDSEDSLIALHARLSRPLTFITSDNNFAETLRGGLKTLDAALPQRAGDLPLKVLDSAGFISENKDSIGAWPPRPRTKLVRRGSRDLAARGPLTTASGLAP